MLAARLNDTLSRVTIEAKLAGVTLKPLTAALNKSWDHD
jgi:hypothetical protein